ncbi:MAG: AI-2E family transporter [Cyclobacteriaceae bacterium]|nr:AI-2E family transporter [Cyclobacteriaceae bacterium]MDH4296273.1 AI-2E family transporter [Cyclobacteriaceae bacterium]MDH5250370.1 AI-2E family transporter [Cyclobacteriaceae bacterium]
MGENRLSGRSITIERVAALFFLAGLCVLCLVYFSSFLQPLILAIMLWYLIYELRVAGGAIKIRGRQLPAWLITLLAFSIVILVILGVIEIITYNLQLIRQSTPLYLANLRVMLNSIQEIPGFEIVQQRIVQRIESFDFNPILTGLLNGISGMAGNIFLIIIYVAFLLAEQSLFAKKIRLLLSDQSRLGAVQRIVSQVNSAVRIYVYVKTLMSILTAILGYFILLLFHVDFPVLWAFVIFLLNYIPYVGSLVATLLPSAFAVFQFQSFSIFIWIFLSIQAVQIVVGNILEPKVMGKTLNLSPLGVLLALTFWGMIWGVMGMILSVPITSILVIIASRFPGTRFVAVLFSETGELPEQ